jgi:hypothetical protein
LAKIIPVVADQDYYSVVNRPAADKNRPARLAAGRSTGRAVLLREFLWLTFFGHFYQILALFTAPRDI